MITRLTLYLFLVGVFYWYCTTDGHLWNEPGAGSNRINLGSVKLGSYNPANAIIQDSLSREFSLGDENFYDEIAGKQLNRDILPRFIFATKESL